MNKIIAIAILFLASFAYSMEEDIVLKESSHDDLAYKLADILLTNSIKLGVDIHRDNYETNLSDTYFNNYIKIVKDILTLPLKELLSSFSDTQLSDLIICHDNPKYFKLLKKITNAHDEINKFINEVSLTPVTINLKDQENDSLAKYFESIKPMLTKMITYSPNSIVDTHTIIDLFISNIRIEFPDEIDTMNYLSDNYPHLASDIDKLIKKYQSQIDCENEKLMLQY